MVFTEKMNQAIAKLADTYSLSLVVLFGSQATGKTHKESDVDVAYYSHSKLNFDQEISLNADLTGIFKNDKLSLVNLKIASPLLAKEIVSHGIVIYTDDSSLFGQLYARAFRMYEEAKPIFELRRHYINNRLKEYHHA